MRFDEDNGTLFGTIKDICGRERILGMQEVTVGVRTVTLLI